MQISLGHKGLQLGRAAQPMKDLSTRHNKDLQSTTLLLGLKLIAAGLL
jgi:hypothetical protein